MEYADRALAIDPNNWIALTSKALALINLSRYQEVMEYADRVLEIDPNDANALTNKGAALAGLGRYQEDIGYFDQVLNQQAATVTLTSNNKEYPIILITNNNIADSENDYSIKNLALLFLHQQPYSTNNLGPRGEEGVNMPLHNNLQEMGELHYITSFLTSEIAIEAEANKGIALYHDGNYQGDIDIFDRILANDNRHVPSLYYYGQCMERLGFVDEANQYKNMANEIDPNYNPGFIEVLATTPVLQAIFSPFQ